MLHPKISVEKEKQALFPSSPGGPSTVALISNFHDFILSFYSLVKIDQEKPGWTEKFFHLSNRFILTIIVFYIWVGKHPVSLINRYVCECVQVCVSVFLKNYWT